jgi:hypothetical protein
MAFVPTLRELAGTRITEVPELDSALAGEVKVPVVRVTDPVGATAVPLEVTFAFAPATVTVTARISLIGNVVGEGVTVTVAVEVPGATAVHAFTTLATLSEPRPVA